MRTLDFYGNIPMITKGGYHTLIAGTTGSGKSTLLNGAILHILTQPGTGLYLIDPKRVELSQYRPSAHCLGYGDNLETINQTLRAAVKEMDARFDDMQARRIRETDRPAQYVIIDELAQFCKDGSDQPYYTLTPLLAKIATLGRAAHIYLIACTQRPTRDVITPLIKTNCDCKIALRTADDQESRNIIGISDAVHLPKHGQCIMRHPDAVDPEMWPVRKYEDDLIDYVAQHNAVDWRLDAV